MKKLISLLVALSMIFAFATLLSSCKMPNTDKNPGTSDTDKKPSDNTGDTGSENDPEVRTTVTSAEWKSAFEATNYTANITYEIKSVDPTGSESVTKYTGYTKCAAPTRLDKLPHSEEIVYHTTIDGEKYRIAYKDDSYVAYPDDSEHSFTIDLDLSFAEVSYNIEAGAYYFKSEAENTEFWVYFENGVLIKCIVTSTADKQSVSCTMVYTDIGTTVLTLPEYEFCVPRATVTEDEWSYYQSLTDYTLTESGWMEGEIGTQVIPKTQFDRKLMQANDSAYHVYTTGGTSTEKFYNLRSGEWYEIVNNGTENVYQSAGGYTEDDNYLAKFFKDGYIFDEEKGAYTYSERQHYNGTPGYIYIYFADGKLEKIEFLIFVDMAIADSKYHMEGEITVTLSDIETTTVTLPEIRTTVTEEEFNSHYDINNYTADMTTNIEITGPDISFSGTTQSIDKYTDNAYESQGVNTTEYQLIVLRDGQWYSVSYDNDQYFGTLVDTSYPPASLGEQLGCSFADLTYDVDKGAYHLLIEEDGVVTDNWLYFVAGKFTKQTISLITESEDGTVTTMSATILCSNIGTTDIDVPEFTVKEPTRTTITEDEWNAHSDYYNFSYDQYFSMNITDADDNTLAEDVSYVYCAQSESSIYEENYTEETVKYAYAEDGVWYKVDNGSGPIEITNPTTSLDQLLRLKKDNGEAIAFEDLVYDEHFEAYTLDGEYVQMSDMLFDIYICFEDGILSSVTLDCYTETTIEGVECYQYVSVCFDVYDVGTTEVVLPQ